MNATITHPAVGQLRERWQAAHVVVIPAHVERGLVTRADVGEPGPHAVLAGVRKEEWRWGTGIAVFEQRRHGQHHRRPSPVAFECPAERGQHDGVLAKGIAPNGADGRERRCIENAAKHAAISRCRQRARRAS